MEQNQQQDPSLFQLNVDPVTANTLKSAASWSKVLAILGIIFGLFFIIIGVMLQQTFNNNSELFQDYGNRYQGSTSMLGNIGMAFYIACGILTIIGSVFALNFGNKISTALRTNDQNTLRSGFAGARNYFAFWAILMIIGLLLMILGVLSGSGGFGGM
jgi:hypothetical protein